MRENFKLSAREYLIEYYVVWPGKFWDTMLSVAFYDENKALIDARTEKLTRDDLLYTRNDIMVGDVVTFKGNLKKDAKKFSIYLWNDDMKPSDWLSTTNIQ